MNPNYWNCLHFKWRKTKLTKKTIKYLPPEIWTLIFARLPVKTLIQFRCVCKSWCSIIDSPNFVHLHLQLCNINHNNKITLLVALELLRVNGKYKRSLTIHKADTFRIITDIFTSSKIYRLLASCNGLILTYDRFYNERNLRLWNPSIRKSLLIPPCPIPSYFNLEIAYVFGFATSNEDHKILVITFDKTTGTRPIDMFVAVYTLNDQRWTVRNNGLNVERSRFEYIFWTYSSPSRTVFFQGAVHAYCAGKGNDMLGDDKEYLVSLDFDLEEFTFSELPVISDKNYPKKPLFILGESLAIFSISEVSFSIWVSELDDGKRVWTPWFSGPSNPDNLDLFNPYIGKVFYYESDDGCCLISGKWSYNIASCQMQECGKSKGYVLEVETYSESLVLHKGYGAQNDVYPEN